MYNVEFKPRADEDLSKMDNSLAQRFIKHSKRMAFNPSKKHLMHGKPYFIEKVTEQARKIGRAHV